MGATTTFVRIIAAIALALAGGGIQNKQRMYQRAPVVNGTKQWYFQVAAKEVAGHEQCRRVQKADARAYHATHGKAATHKRIIPETKNEANEMWNTIGSNDKDILELGNILEQLQEHGRRGLERSWQQRERSNPEDAAKDRKRYGNRRSMGKPRRHDVQLRRIGKSW